MMGAQLRWEMSARRSRRAFSISFRYFASTTGSAMAAREADALGLLSSVDSGRALSGFGCLFIFNVREVGEGSVVLRVRRTRTEEVG